MPGGLRLSNSDLVLAGHVRPPSHGLATFMLLARTHTRIVRWIQAISLVGCLGGTHRFRDVLERRGQTMAVRPAASGVTLDAEQARDLDDAFWVERLEGGFRLSVYVAGVAMIVPVGGPDDEVAASRGLTVYAPGTQREPMFGAHIANGLASLLPRRVRPVVAHEIIYDTSGEVLNSRVFLADFSSRAKLSYESFDHLMDPGGNPEEHSMATAAFDLAAATWRRRVALTGLPDWEAAFDARGRLRPSVGRGQIGQTLVHEFMVAANTAATEAVLASGFPMIYRNQGPRAGGPNGRYELECHGHSALGKASYGPFTNPIRQFVSLVNQRIAVAAVEGLPCPYDVPDLARICAMANRAAQRADGIGRRAVGALAVERQRGLVQGPSSRAGSGPPIERLDAPAFRAALECSDGLNPDLNRELARRIADGLLAPSDVAWLLLGANSPIEDETKLDLLSRMTANPEEAARMFAAASAELGVPPYEAEMRDIGGGRWLAAAALGRHVGDATDADPARARGLALIGLAASMIHLPMPELRPPGEGLRVADDQGRERLASLCRLMGWGEPEYDIVDKSNKMRPLHGGTVSVATDDFPYSSPVVHGSTRRSALLIAAELALSALGYYARDSIRRDDAAFGPDFGRLSHDAVALGPKEALEHFCQRSGASLRRLWLAERPAIHRFSCLLEISAAGQTLRVPGEGADRDEALLEASWEAVGVILGRDAKPPVQVAGPTPEREAADMAGVTFTQAARY